MRSTSPRVTPLTSSASTATSAAATTAAIPWRRARFITAAAIPDMGMWARGFPPTAVTAGQWVRWCPAWTRPAVVAGPVIRARTARFATRKYR